MADLSIAQYIGQKSVSDNIQQVLREKTPQFIASVTSLVNASDALKKAEKSSVLLACLTAASLDLPINQNLGFAYIIPYNDTKSGLTVAQFQMGYRGYMQLGMRSGQFKTINVTEVREGELVKNNLLTGEIEFDWKEDREKLPIVGYVAFIELTNGFEKVLYMTKEQVSLHGKKYSQTYKKGFGKWTEDFDAMAKKTVLKLLLSKYAPMSIEMQQAQLVDQAVITEEGYQYIDNKQLEAHEVAYQKEKERIEQHIENAKSIADLDIVDQIIGDYELTDIYQNKRKELNEQSKLE